MSVVDTHTQPSGDASARFTALFRATHGDLVRYVRARCPRDRVDDVVAETFLTAWRRFEQVPGDDGAARAWLFVAARNLLLNDNRREGRREHLPLLIELGGDGAGELVERRAGDFSRGIDRRGISRYTTVDYPSGAPSDVPSRNPSGGPPVGTPGLDDEVAFRLDLAAALRSLSDADQEVLGLAVVDGLSPAEAGVVLGISANTYAARLSRARKRLAAALDEGPEAASTRSPQAAISNRADPHRPTTASPPLRAAASPGSAHARPPTQARAVRAPHRTATTRPSQTPNPNRATHPTDSSESDGTDTFRSTP